MEELEDTKGVIRSKGWTINDQEQTDKQWSPQHYKES